MYSRKGYMDETYEILGYLGSGSGGVIYKAYHKRLHRPTDQLSLGKLSSFFHKFFQ